MRVWIDGICKAIEALLAACLAVMVVLVFGNVVLRYGFNSGITVSEEVSRWLFIWITFLGAVVALKENSHLGVDMVVSKLSPAGRKFCLVASHGVMLYILWLLADGSLSQIEINREVTAPVTGASMAIIYLASLVFAVGAAVLLLGNLLRVVTGRLSDDELITIQESEEAAVLAQVLPPASAAGREAGSQGGAR